MPAALTKSSGDVCTSAGMNPLHSEAHVGTGEYRYYLEVIVVITINLAAFWSGSYGTLMAERHRESLESHEGSAIIPNCIRSDSPTPLLPCKTTKLITSKSRRMQRRARNQDGG